MKDEGGMMSILKAFKERILATLEIRRNPKLLIQLQNNKLLIIL